jgi:hypothetical protein
VVRPFCSSERSDECETAVSFWPLYPHDLVDAWADALVVTRDTASPLREMSTAGWPLASTMPVSHQSKSAKQSPR